LIRVFSHWLPSQVLFQVVLDLFLLVAMVLCAAWLNHADAPTLWIVAPYAVTFAVITVALNKVMGLYQIQATRSTAHLAALTLVSLFLSAPMAYALFGEVPTPQVGYAALQVGALLALLAIVTLRVSAATLGLGPVMTRRVMVLGTGPEAEAVEKSLQRGSVRVVGFYPVGNDSEIHVPHGRLVAPGDSLAATTRKLKVNEIIVAISERRGGGMPVNDLLECKLAGVRVLDLSSYFERALGQVRLDSLRASWLIFGDGFRQGAVRSFIKRVFDIVVATALLVLSLPIVLLTAVCILAESGLPLLYRQERVGQAGRLFHVIKFRSMRSDAESDGKPRWAASNDERVTSVGRFIRKYRIDEVPQLLNVLRGEMSLVGPRPERPYFVDTLTQEVPFYAARHSLKPGLTGWAQVRYHYGSSADDSINKLQFDLYYVKNHTLFLDLIILFETVIVVVTGKGAQ
jgi:sugar transferase (PEP-CTERM system associated)